MAEQVVTGCIEIHTHVVHAILDHIFEILLQLCLVQVVLVLTDANRFGINLDELTEWILNRRARELEQP